MLQTELPDLKVWLTSTTEQWAVIAVQGPRAREVLAPLVEGIDLAATALPHMSVADRAHRWRADARLFRVSFTGELGFEINVPADYGAAMWEAVWRRVQRARRLRLRHRDDARAARREGLHHRRPGNRRHGDAGRRRARLGDRQIKRDFVGMRSLARPDMVRAGRKQLVGLLTEDPALVLEEGAQVTVGSATADRHARARPCHLGLLERGARPVDRAGAGCRRPQAHGRDGCMCRCRPATWRSTSLRRCSSIRRERGSMADAAMPRQSALAGLSLPLKAGVATVSDPGAAARFVYRGAPEPFPVTFGVALPTTPMRAHAEGQRAALWLGPDEWLLLAPVRGWTSSRRRARRGVERPGGVAGRCQVIVRSGSSSPARARRN